MRTEQIAIAANRVPAHIRELRREQRRIADSTKYVSVPTSREWATWGHGDGIGPMQYLADCAVEPDGTVRVYDDISGHYTICHSLPDSLQSQARRLAGIGGAL